MNALVLRKDRGRPLRTLLLALLFTFACAEALAATDTSGKQGLVVALDYLMPEHRVDRKFRSPETIDAALAEDLAQHLQLPLTVVRAKQAEDTATPKAGKGSLRLTTLVDPAAVPRTHVVIPVRYRSAPMAIMRSDTTIKRWEQLKGRTVCVSEGGNHAGTIAAQYGAVEQLYPAPADALIALRSGVCDATVHDSAMLEELIRLPEWKKVSARLPPGEGRTLAFLVPADDKPAVATVRRIAGDWNANGYPEALMKKAVRSIAFEVYLDQDVPDCH